MFRILNLAEARFDCTYGRGCDGVCCRKGRPLVYRDEAERIDRILPELLPSLRPEAWKAIRRRGYLKSRTRLGQRVMRGAGGGASFTTTDACCIVRARKRATNSR